MCQGSFKSHPPTPPPTPAIPPIHTICSIDEETWVLQSKEPVQNHKVYNAVPWYAHIYELEEKVVIEDTGKDYRENIGSIMHMAEIVKCIGGKTEKHQEN